MTIIWILFLPLIYLILKLFLNQIVKKYGKFSYDGFSAAGFTYNAEKDIFYSSKKAWQKNFGYTKLYDIIAPFFQMIIDTEPIQFRYRNKNWLITFWKGQYGIVTGAEIGIYCTKQQANRKTIYFPPEENEMLPMDILLYKNGKLIAKVTNIKHWWLAVFKLGMFSNPNELSMNINITFPNKEMRNAFLEAFLKKGYSYQEIKVIDNTFGFKYEKPHTRKVWTRNWITDKFYQSINRKNVELYNLYLEDLIDDNRIDDSKNDSSNKVILLKEWIPELLKNEPENPLQIEQIEKRLWTEKNIILLKEELLTTKGNKR